MKNVMTVYALGLFLSLFFGVMGVVQAEDVAEFDTESRTLWMPSVKMDGALYRNVELFVGENGNCQVIDFEDPVEPGPVETEFPDDDRLQWKPDCNGFGPQPECG